MKGVIYRMAQQVPVEEIRRPEPAIIIKKKNGKKKMKSGTGLLSFPLIPSEILTVLSIL